MKGSNFMRNIYTVNATQVVVSESHPEGMYSVIQGYPKTYDSRNYEATEQNPNGNEALALIVARAEFADRVKQLSLAHNRAMWTVTLDRADGRQIMRETFGAFPDMTPQPEEESAE
jgi:hypothetical protein